MDTSHANQLLRDGYPNEAVLSGADPSDAINVLKQKSHAHLVVRGDSLSLPRPVRYDEYGIHNPYLATRFENTFPCILAQRYESHLNKKVYMTNTSLRGMQWPAYESGIGRGLEDVLSTLGADIFVSLWGYTQIWLHKEETSSFDKIDDISEKYTKTINALQQRFPLMIVVVVDLPLPGPGLSERFPRMGDYIDFFNQNNSERLNKNIFRYTIPNHKTILHDDQQHFSSDGHLAIADGIFDLTMSCALCYHSLQNMLATDSEV
ncbi:SGNH/GDSL hydrolase family protein [Methylobacterium sp. CB376]|uniref:SGNH/GDSL hydrolase family protein n=1 Tax=unclassified Methylobacterium TaxID=2615210 RepID=UPI00123796BF|nr:MULTISPECIES: SGNH/GDSL hydrolase family protein [Methylobacterium]WFT77482.1 SGNH/GDSL hydrolase family protein [Methylobacterium nodulans]